MRKRTKFLLAGALIAGIIGAANADVNYTQGSGTVIFAFTCFTTKVCPAQTLVNSSGTEIGTSGSPVRTDPTGSTTQPVSGTVTSNAGTGTRAVSAASGSIASGAMVDLGSQADAACGTATGSCSLIALQKFNNTATTSPLAAGTAIIGRVGIDQTTPGTTNGTQDAASGATGSAVPSKAMFAGARSGANLVGLIQADTSAAINVSTATTTQLVALSGSTKIYVTSYNVISGGTGNITFVYGTGSNCGTGTTSLTGAYNFTAQAGIAIGSGLSPVLVVPSGNALCVTTTAAVQMSGSVSYTQF